MTIVEGNGYYIASKCKEPIIRFLTTKLPLNPEGDYTTGLEGEPIYGSYAGQSEDNFPEIKTDNGLEGNKETVYYLKVHSSAEECFMGPRKFIEFVKKNIGKKVSAGAFLFHEIQSYYDGKKVLTKEMANEYFTPFEQAYYKAIMQKNYDFIPGTFHFPLSIWFDLVREEHESVQDDSADPRVAQLYEEMILEFQYYEKIKSWMRMDQYSTEEYLIHKGVPEKHLQHIYLGNKVTIQDKSFECPSNDDNAYCSPAFRLIKRTIEEKGGCVAELKEYPQVSIPDYTIIIEPYDPFNSGIYRAAEYKRNIITDIQFWKAVYKWEGLWH